MAGEGVWWGLELGSGGWLWCKVWRGCGAGGLLMGRSVAWIREKDGKGRDVVEAMVKVWQRGCDCQWGGRCVEQVDRCGWRCGER